jgi:hypothetical protein
MSPSALLLLARVAVAEASVEYRYLGVMRAGRLLEDRETRTVRVTLTGRRSGWRVPNASVGRSGGTSGSGCLRASDGSRARPPV